MLRRLRVSANINNGENFYNIGKGERWLIIRLRSFAKRLRNCKKS